MPIIVKTVTSRSAVTIADLTVSVVCVFQIVNLPLLVLSYR